MISIKLMIGFIYHWKSIIEHWIIASARLPHSGTHIFFFLLLLLLIYYHYIIMVFSPSDGMSFCCDYFNTQTLCWRIEFITNNIIYGQWWGQYNAKEYSEHTNRYDNKNQRMRFWEVEGVGKQKKTWKEMKNGKNNNNNK